MQDPVCPIHNCVLSERDTKYGVTWRCPIHGCTVRWWGSENTTPCDYETAQARQKAHGVVDPLWKSHRMHRATLYRKMKRDIGIEHIGLCDRATCERIIEWASKL